MGSRSHTFLLITIFMIATANSFSLIGQWTLSRQHLQFASNLNQTNITFAFSQQVNPRGQISRHITVTTCRTMFYTFTFRQNSIVPIFTRFGNNTRICQGQEVNEIRRKMESVFYFSIVNNRLILIYPSKLVAFTLFRENLLPVGIKGNWKVAQIESKKINDGEKINIEDEKIVFCGGKASLGYKVESGNIISVENEVKGDISGCPDLMSVIQTLKRSKYYKKSEEQLRFYNKDGEIILKLAPQTAAPSLSPISNRQTLHNKWYIHSLNGTRLNQQTEPIYYYYFLIITPERFRFYGGCNVQFSFYELTDGYQVVHRDVHYVKKPTCRYVNQDTLVLNSLFNNGKFLAYNQNTGILSFFDDDKNNFIEFTTVMPETRDILPNANL